MSAPPIGVTGGSYWGTTGTIPKYNSIPTTNPLTGNPLAALEANIAPVAFPNSIVFYDPLGADVDWHDYASYLSPGEYVYFPAPDNLLFRVINYRRISDTQFVGDIVEGIVPAAPGPTAKTPSYVKAKPGFTFVVQGAAVTVNGVSMAVGMSLTEPDILKARTKVYNYDATGVGASLLITINEL